MSITEARTFKELEQPVINQNGFLANVDVLQPDGPHDMLGTEYLTHACAEGETWAELCYAVDQTPCVVPGGGIVAPVGGYKQFGRPELVSGSPFAVYDGVDCELTTLEDEAAMAQSRLSFSEPRQVDRNVLARLDDAVTVDLGAETVASAIAQMEDHSSALYGSYGIISMPRSLVTAAVAQRLVFLSPTGGLQTAVGTKVIAVAQEVPGGTTEMFLSGRITLIQGPVHMKSVASVTLPDGECKPMRALAERMYVPLIECMVVKATATPT